MKRTWIPLCSATAVVLTACGSTGSGASSLTSETSAVPSTSSAAASPSVAPAIDAALRARMDAAPAVAGTPAGPLEVVAPAPFRADSHESAPGLVGAARRSVVFAGHIDGVQLVMRFGDAASAAADARNAAASPLDQGQKQEFTDAAIPGSAGYDHVVNGIVVSRDLFFSVGADEIRLGCASDGHGHPTRRALLRAARAWNRALQQIPTT